MTQDQLRTLARTYGLRMCDEHGETHDEELYCFDLWELKELIMAAIEQMKDKPDVKN